MTPKEAIYLADYCLNNTQVREALKDMARQIEELQADSELIEYLNDNLDFDGYGYWLPELCIRSRDLGEDFVPPPTIEQFRSAIDAARKAK